jgi:hypothetical protein
MLNVSGGKMTMTCNHKGCKNSIQTDILKSRPADTVDVLVKQAKKRGWDDGKCPTHK